MQINFCGYDAITQDGPSVWRMHVNTAFQDAERVQADAGERYSRAVRSFTLCILE